MAQSKAKFTSNIYNPHDYPKCPHCGVEQEDPAGDLVIPGRVGNASIATSMCDVCDFEYTAERLEGGDVRIEKA